MKIAAVLDLASAVAKSMEAPVIIVVVMVTAIVVVVVMVMQSSGKSSGSRCRSSYNAGSSSSIEV